MKFIDELNILIESSAARDQSIRDIQNTLEPIVDENDKDKSVTFDIEDQEKNKGVFFGKDLMKLDYKYLDSLHKNGMIKSKIEEIKDVPDTINFGNNRIDIDPPIAIFIPEVAAGFSRELQNESISNIIKIDKKDELLKYINRQRRNFIKTELNEGDSYEK
jgi:hypothetical protein